MMPLDILNYILTIVTIFFGLFGWLSPQKTMQYVGLQTLDESAMGLSEVRAASGALWVFTGLGALYLHVPAAFLMVGFLYLGASIGRVCAIIFDKARSIKVFVFFAVEAGFAFLLLFFNF